MSSDQEHIAYPHEPGYLDSCGACEYGPCECSAPCYEESCTAREFVTIGHEPGARFAHQAPCVSVHCENPANYANAEV